MNKYKESIYNIKKYTDNKLIIFNTLSGKFVQFDSDISTDIYDHINNIEQKECNGITKMLVKYSFLVENNYSEKLELEKLKQNIVNKTNQLSLIIFPTEKCNFRCKYCYEDFNEPSMSEDTQQDVIDFIKTNVKKYKTISVDWFGGEPLLSIEVIENLSKKIISICNENKVKYLANITTNGYNLTYEMFNRLKKCRVYSYQITIDGLANTHNYQRILSNGEGTWEKIIENLKCIRDNSKSGLISITIRTNITREIYNSFKEYLEFIKSEFGRDKRFKYLFRLASDWGNLNDSEIKSKFCGEDEYLEILKYSLKKDFYNVGIKKSLVPGGLLCYAWKINTIAIRANGGISKCTLNLYDKVNQISNITKYKNEENYEFWDFSKRSIPKKCMGCKKYPICLKVDCNMSNKEALVDCDPDIDKLENIIQYICKEEYGCEYFNREEVDKYE